MSGIDMIINIVVFLLFAFVGWFTADLVRRFK